MTKRKRPGPKLQPLPFRVGVLDTRRGTPLPKAVNTEVRERKRIYDSARWRYNIQPTKLRNDPMCQACTYAGRAVPAVVVDHWVSLARGGDPWKMDGLVSLCREHHDIKSKAEHRGETEFFPIVPSRVVEPGFA